jgi:nucleoside-diphosphate-sugar epimerase
VSEGLTKGKLRVLVTGGAGFIGSHLVPKLLEKKFSVAVFDNLSSGNLKNFSEIETDPSFSFIRGDIRDLTALQEACRGRREWLEQKS